MLLLIITLSASIVSSANILAVFPLICKSHFITFEPIVTELAKRGHEVTVISYFPKNKNISGYTDIGMEKVDAFDIPIRIEDLVNMAKSVSSTLSVYSGIAKSFESIYKDSRVSKLLNSSVKFDLVITELLLSDMFLALAHKYDAPLVMLGSSEVVPWGADRVALPDNPSYIPHFLNYHVSGPMTFYDRMVNTLEVLYYKYKYREIVEISDVMSRRYLGEVPRVEDMMRRTSLVLVNTHYSVNGARPLPPQVVEIGGIHIKPEKPLPQEIENFINESKDGVIYFSFGSIANAYTMKVEMLDALCAVFSKIPQRVLWKWETEELPCKLSNVKFAKWMPQRDVLAHPNVRLFISHGGLLGLMEAVHCGVPVVGIPIFGDQKQNIAYLAEIGYAVRVDVDNMTEESVSYAVNTGLNDPNYRQTAKHISQTFRDRPSSALDTAIYWIHYVLRHKGAHHLRSAAVNLTWYQYILLDVIGTVMLVALLLTWTILYAVKTVICRVKRKVKVN